jgi:hypothetical protein
MKHAILYHPTVVNVGVVEVYIRIIVAAGLGAALSML